MTDVGKNITVDYDEGVLTIDGQVLPWGMEADPIVTANASGGQTPGVTVRFLAEEVTVRGVPSSVLKSAMDRKQAIAYVWGLHSAVDSEFCCSSEERAEAEADTRAALLALGVREDEL